MTSLSTDNWFLKDLKSRNWLACFLGRTLNFPKVFHVVSSVLLEVLYLTKYYSYIFNKASLFLYSKQLNLLVKSWHTSVQSNTLPKMLLHFLNWVSHNTLSENPFLVNLDQKQAPSETTCIFVRFETLHKAKLVCMASNLFDKITLLMQYCSI